MIAVITRISQSHTIVEIEVHQRGPIPQDQINHLHRDIHKFGIARSRGDRKVLDMFKARHQEKNEAIKYVIASRQLNPMQSWQMVYY